MSTNKLPEAFERMYSHTFGAEEYRRLVEALAETPPVSIRLHPDKCRIDREQVQLVPWCPDGLYIEGQKPIFAADPLWHAGCYYVQEASSMFVAQYLSTLDTPPRTCLDLCAAPGGKSTLLRSLLPEGCLLTANEPNGTRSTVLAENLARYGAEETIVTRALPQQIAASGASFDLILVDAPCSGEGLFRRQPEAIKEWSEANVAMCAERQQEILDAACEMLNPGGVLLYSTCTYNRIENEDRLEALLSLHSAYTPIRIEEVHPSVRTPLHEAVYRFMPQYVRGEGFSIFGVRKSTAPGSTPTKQRGKEKVKGKNTPPELASLDPARLYLSSEGTWRLLSPEGQALCDRLGSARIPIRSAGIELGSVKGNKLIPAAAWALCATAVGSAPYPTLALSAEEAFAFLRREPLQLSSEARGFHLVTYRDAALGWVNCVGRRANNLFPKGFAIASSYLTPKDLPNHLPIFPTSHVPTH